MPQRLLTRGSGSKITLCACVCACTYTRLCLAAGQTDSEWEFLTPWRILQAGLSAVCRQLTHQPSISCCLGPSTHNTHTHTLTVVSVCIVMLYGHKSLEVERAGGGALVSGPQSSSVQQEQLCCSYVMRMCLFLFVTSAFIMFTSCLKSGNNSNKN